MFFLGLIIGLVLGSLFSAFFLKWGNRAKSAGKEFYQDINAEIEKKKQHNKTL